MLMHHCREFIAEFVLHPKSTGAVAPSSNVLARRVVSCVDWENVQAVLEYGPGTGVVTEHILSRLPPNVMFLAIEINARFTEILRRRYPQAKICRDSVANVASICRDYGIESVDAILSGLPWSSFSERDQTTYLDAMMSVLKPAGLFVTFAYWQGLLLPGGQRFKKQLQRHFSEVRMSKPIWANLPPAFLYCCRL